MKKVIICLFIILIGANIAYAGQQQEFTTKSLKQFNGKKGQPAYIAVDGVVYDVSKVWHNGEHNGYYAGNDLSVPIRKYPTMRENLKKVPVVGKFKP